MGGGANVSKTEFRDKYGEIKNKLTRLINMLKTMLH